MRAAIVSNDGIHVDGLLSERDIVHGLEVFGAKLLQKRVEDVMTKKVAELHRRCPTSCSYVANVRS